MEKLISIDLKSDFGFFRKPDANNTINLSYNMLHKPALLGIFGAIVGLQGYKAKGIQPKYYEIFKNIKIGIEPIDHEKGNFQKTTIIYSDTTGFNNNDKNKLPATRIMEEVTLIKPCYRVYTLLDLDDDNQHLLYDYLKEGKAEYLPYFGKNEFAAWWENFREYDYQAVEKPLSNFKIRTLFLKQDIIKKQKAAPFLDFMNFWENETPFMYFERLPKSFDLTLFQYDLGDSVFTTFGLKQSANISNLYHLTGSEYYVQLI